MFASLKNKIREETGSDISKLTSKISSSVPRHDSLSLRHSHHGSTSSINSLVSIDGIKEEISSLNDFKTDDDTKRQLSKIEADYVKKLEEKENEWREKLQQQEKQLKQVENEKNTVIKITCELREQLAQAEGFKQKLMEYQEDKEQLENFQTQEIAKVKHLVLLREQELAERTTTLKDCMQQMEKLKGEVSRLRRQEEHLSDVQDDLESLRHSSARDLAAIASELARSEEERRHLSDLVAVLRQRTETSGDSAEDQLLIERKMLEQRLEEAHLHLADIKTSWCEKISSLETQVGRLSRQAAEEGTERRRAVEEKEQLLDRVKQMEWELECNKLELNNKDSKISRLISEIEDLTVDMKAAKSESDEEVTFLRKQIEKCNGESSELQMKLTQSITDLETIQIEQKKLQELKEDEDKINEELRNKIKKMEKELYDERSQYMDIQKELHNESSERNVALLRNAEISQQMEIVKQESRHKENEISELLNKVSHLESSLKELKELQMKANTENDLRSHIADLEEQLIDKNKNIKTLQMRLTDMKKALQQELRAPGQNIDSFELANNPVAVISPSQSTTKHLYTTNSHFPREEEDINFKYLKHVIIKFLTSREYEAQHLTRAVATLLKFSPDEEKLLHDTLEWKMSWFGSRPNLGIGQTAKAIPPS